MYFFLSKEWESGSLFGPIEREAFILTITSDHDIISFQRTRRIYIEIKGSEKGYQEEYIVS